MEQTANIFYILYQSAQEVFSMLLQGFQTVYATLNEPLRVLAVKPFELLPDGVLTDLVEALTMWILNNEFFSYTTLDLMFILMPILVGFIIVGFVINAIPVFGG